jgi:D-alanine-D-alanine ligase
VVTGKLEAGSRRRLRDLERELRGQAGELALFLIYDRPSQVLERPALARTFFAQRCVSDDQLERMIEAFRSLSAYVEVFEGDQPFIAALADGRLHRLRRRVLVAYNGIGSGICPGGFIAGRKALIPLIADSYGVICANSDAYACAVARHKFHCFTILRALGVRTPRTWHYRSPAGWVGGSPSAGTKVIVKSTFEAWSVGVSEESVFQIDESADQRTRAIAAAIGQPVTVQEFIAGAEVYVPVLSCPELIVAPPMQAVLDRAPGDTEAVMTFEDNMREGSVSYRPFEGPAEVVARLRSEATRVFDALQLQGFARVDFRVDQDGIPWVFDIAVSPGLEYGGASHRSLAQYGFDHASFMRLVVASTLRSRGQLAG